MWIVTKIGFFSIVEKPEDRGLRTLTVRARIRKDLEALRDVILLPTTEISRTASDYQFRMRVPRMALMVGLARIVEDIDYENFKDEVKRTSTSRALVYTQVWIALRRLARRRHKEKGNS